MLAAILVVLTLLATLWGVYYARGQLREARSVREQNENFNEAQRLEDDLWAAKYVRAATLLCEIADLDRLSIFTGPRNFTYAGGALRAVFSESVCKHIQGQLIQRQNDDSYALRPIETSQLRLKTNRDLIDLVLTKIEKMETLKRQ